MLICPEHNKEVKPSKFREGEYWHKEPNMERACTKNLDQLKQIEKFDATVEQLEAKSQEMTKEEWVDKERRAVRRSQMSTLLNQGMSLKDAFKQNLDLKGWEEYVMTGKGPEAQMKSDVDEILGEE